MSTKLIKNIKYKLLMLYYLVTFKVFPVFEIRKNLDLKKILVTSKIFLESRFVCSSFIKKWHIYPKMAHLSKNSTSNTLS